MRARRVDANHGVLTAAFRQLGASVWDTSRCGSGGPDAVIGYMGLSVPVEFKVPGKKLNALQEEWHANWQGSKAVVTDHEGVIRLLETMRYMAGHGRA